MAKIQVGILGATGAAGQRFIQILADHPILVQNELDRPQPRLDRDAEGGMSVTVGRVRECPILDLRLVSVSHNTLRGAAGGSVLVAEQLVADGYLK